MARLELFDPRDLVSDTYIEKGSASDVHKQFQLMIPDYIIDE